MAELLTIDQAAAILWPDKPVCRRTVKRLCKDGNRRGVKLPYYSINGRDYQFNLADVSRFIEQCRVDPNEPDGKPKPRGPRRKLHLLRGDAA